MIPGIFHEYYCENLVTVLSINTRPFSPISLMLFEVAY